MKKQERIDRVELMRTFIRIVESGSLSAAARQLETTQATISRRLQSLESLLGAKLILRSTHAMKLTDDGERCYQHARQVVDAWLALEDELQLTDDQPVGTLRVRAPHAFGQEQLLMPLIGFWPNIHSCRSNGCSMIKTSTLSVTILIARSALGRKLTRPPSLCCWLKSHAVRWPLLNC